MGGLEDVSAADVVVGLELTMFVVTLFDQSSLKSPDIVPVPHRKPRRPMHGSGIEQVRHREIVEA